VDAGAAQGLQAPPTLEYFVGMRPRDGKMLAWTKTQVPEIECYYLYSVVCKWIYTNKAKWMDRFVRHPCIGGDPFADTGYGSRDRVGL